MRELYGHHEWLAEAQQRAVALFPNQGLHDQARFIASLHPRAIEYLEQAPVLACALGAHRTTRSDKLYIAQRIGGPIERGERLRHVMKAVELPTPLRQLAPFALGPTSRPTIYRLARIEPSPLSLAIPGRPGDQRKWLSALKDWHEAQVRRTRVASLPFSWAVREISRHLPPSGEITAVVDFLISNQGNDRWSWEKAMAETQGWHDRLADERSVREITGGLSLDICIDISELPDAWADSGLQFVKLDTPAKLIEEGRKMRHCVASYVRYVVDGRASVYSIRNSERRIATLEIDPHDKRVVQLQGFGNSKVKPYVSKAAATFSRRLARKEAND